MTYKETIPGEFYTVVNDDYKGKYRWITRTPNNVEGYPYLEILSSKNGAYTLGGSGSFADLKYKFEPATWEERQWLQNCINADKLTSKPESIETYQIY